MPSFPRFPTSFPSFPNVSFLRDFPSIDLSAFELPSFELPKLDLSRLDIPGVDRDQLLAFARDAAYVAVGMGVLTVQQLQVRRRELVDRLDDLPLAKQLGLTREHLDDIAQHVAGLVTGPVAGFLSARVDAARALFRNAA